MLNITSKGDFAKLTAYFNKLTKSRYGEIAEKYGNAGVSALSSATPVDSGLTATSWYFTVDSQNGSTRINFCNSATNNGVSIAIILQYGHGTGTGGWVEGRDYINPAIQPIFDKLAESAWEEVTRL